MSKYINIKENFIVLILTIIWIFLIISICASKAEDHQIKRSILINSLPSTADILFVSNRDTGSRRTEIYAISVDGNNVVRITDTEYHHFIMGIDRSRRYIVTSRAEEDTHEPIGLGDEDRRTLWLIDLKTKQEIRLTDPANHAEGDSFSPNGEWIVFHMKLAGQEQSDIYKIRRDGTWLTQLTNTSSAIEADPCWSNDGTEIAFTYLDVEVPRFVLNKMDKNGENIQTIYDGGEGISTPGFPSGNYDPSWSPDDQWLVYERAISFSGENWDNGIWHIFKVRREGTDVIDLSQTGGHTGWAEFLPSFSPDGNFIVFASYYEDADPLNSHDDVLLMDINGSSVMKITSNPASDKYPVWIPIEQSDNVQLDVEDGKIKIQGGTKGYVNPLKGENAKIYFWTNAPGKVELKIYTMRGQLIREFNIETMGDKETINWDCKNKEGNIVASGIYIVYIEGPGIKDTKKIAVVK